MISYKAASTDQVDNPSPLLLCVDDEEMLLTLKSEILSSLGYAVITTDQPGTACEALNHFPVDALITDFDMPGMNGGDLARIVKRRTMPPPVILHSGAANAGAYHPGLFDRYISKARPLNELIENIESVVAHAIRSSKTIAAE